MRKQLMPIAALAATLVCTTGYAEGMLPMTDFNDGETGGWGKGGAATNPVTVEFEADGNGYLKFISNGPEAEDDSDKRVVFHNDSNAWRGNYNAMGVTGIKLRMKNMGEAPLDFHAGFGNTLADLRTRYVTEANTVLPNDGEWHELTFSYRADLHMVAIGGHGKSSAAFSPDETLGNIAALRFTHGTLGEDYGHGEFEGWNGAKEEKTELWIDDIELLTE